MISESILSQWRADRQWWVYFIVGLFALAVLAFIEEGSWRSALIAPLGIAAFIATTICISDLVMWIFGKGQIGKHSGVMFAIALVLTGLLALFANPIFLILLSFFVSCVLLSAGWIKPSLIGGDRKYNQKAKRRQGNGKRK